MLSEGDAVYYNMPLLSCLVVTAQTLKAADIAAKQVAFFCTIIVNFSVPEWNRSYILVDAELSARPQWSVV